VEGCLRSIHLKKKYQYEQKRFFQKQQYGYKNAEFYDDSKFIEMGLLFQLWAKNQANFTI
jgi:hypothetical protein